MYTPTPNFLNDPSRYGQSSPSSQTGNGKTYRPLWIGIGVGVIALAIMGGSYGYVNNRLQELIIRKNQLAVEEGDLKQQLGTINTVNQSITTIDQEATGLTTVLNNIRAWSAIFTDLRSRVPQKVQITNIAQSLDSENKPAPQINITGQARTFTDINDFMLLLQESPFLDAPKVRLVNSTLKAVNPNSSGDQTTKVVEYQIEAPLNPKPITDPDILSHLARHGAIGVVTRIQELKKQGVIQ